MDENRNDALNIFNGPLPTETPQEQPKVLEDEVVTSGTATEEQIVVDAVKPENEVLDEEEIKKDVKEEKVKSKNSVLFIAVVILILVAFIIALPFIIKALGIGL